jgi:hypothetical protein
MTVRTEPLMHQEPKRRHGKAIENAQKVERNPRASYHVEYTRRSVLMKGELMWNTLS